MRWSCEPAPLPARHAELVSASIYPPRPLFNEAANFEVCTFYRAAEYAKRWTLKQVQGDGF